jgi:hypothetical protein
LQENWIDTLVQRAEPDLTYYEKKENPPALLISKAWNGESAGFYRARTCVFEAKGKFRAETLVIYPCVGQLLPVFGCEYIELPSKSLAVIDFHPIGGNLGPVMEALSSEPDRKVEKSAFYDLNGFFSPKMWHERGGKEIYEPFKEAAERYIDRYYGLLGGNLPSGGDYRTLHAPYNEYMGANDPAHGILKAYFSKEFADEYIREFLFG